jgi:hypothetical protein
MAEVVYSKDGHIVVETIANPFLNKTELMDRDIETALLLERAVITDIGKSTAYTDGCKIYINIEENLSKLLPAYDQRMLKWLLWHEKMHLELRHHNRFFKYLEELDETKTKEQFQVTREEVNIIMDILVHDSMCKMFPELVEVAIANLAQMRNRNSLKYTFKTDTLEKMLDEYKAHKNPEDKDKEETKEDKEETKEDKKEEKTKEDKKEEETKEEETKEEETKKDKKKKSSHDETDWSKLNDIDQKEFITQEESRMIQDAIAKLKRKKFKLSKLTETLNGLVTSTRQRSYTMPSLIHTGGNILLKGSVPGHTKLYLVFDASGSMNNEMNLFKEIISKSIPQAMDTPCEWFAGWTHGAKISPYKIDDSTGDGYYKAKFKDFMGISASNGFRDDGDRTIELCWQAEQLGYSPIGVTDGGGRLSWSKDKLKELKRTVLVGQELDWLQDAKKINPKIQILEV